MDKTTTTILPVEYKGYTIQEDPEWCGYFGSRRLIIYPRRLIIYPTEAGIQHDADCDGERYIYCGNCKWSGTTEEAKEIIDELGYASHTARVKRFKKFYYEYQNWGGTMTWKEFRNDNRFPH